MFFPRVLDADPLRQRIRIQEAGRTPFLGQVLGCSKGPWKDGASVLLEQEIP